MKILRTMALGAALAAVPLALTVGCNPKSQSESAESKDLVKKVAEAQEAESQAQSATQAQAEAMAKAGLQTNQSVIQLKNTSLVSTIAVTDLLYQGTIITAATYRPLEVYTMVAVIYFLVLFPLTLTAQQVERRLARSD